MTRITCLFVLLVPTVAGFTSKKVDSPPSSAYKEMTSNVYIEVDGSIVTTAFINNNYASRIAVYIPFKNITYSIDLILNVHLLAPSYVEKIVTKNGSVLRRTNIGEEFCYYIGKVRNTEQSNAAFSACRGIRGFFVINDTTYHVTPVDYDSSTVEGLHEIRKVAEDNSSQCTCNAEDFDEKMYESFVNRWVTRQIIPESNNEKFVIELYVANDKSRLENFDGDIDDVIRSTKEIANVANLLYQPVGFVVMLVGIEVWQDYDPINVECDSNVTLENWRIYRLDNIIDKHYNDVGFLISNVTFLDNVLGQAAFTSMCSSTRSSGIITATSNNVALSGAILAHEIGHTLGLEHDAPGCVCESPNGVCIMDASIKTSNPPLYFSSCSKDQLKSSRQKGFDICLRNMPSNYSVCGNGVLEPGEDCDCSSTPSQECNRSCCNKTCNLIGSSLCSSGGCCDLDTCQPKRLATECRSVVGSCDLPEFCDGVSPFCPKDVFKHNGLNCSVDGVDAYCWEGHCRTHRTQCQELYGPTARESEDICYTNFNVQGTMSGNCGFKVDNNMISAYKQCQPRNVMCGTLQCFAPSDESRFANILYRTNKSNDKIFCIGAIMDYGSRVENPGMVPNGAFCDPGKMCVSQECVDVDSVLNNNACPECSQGVCNSEGKCYCDQGHGGTNCDRPKGSAQMTKKIAEFPTTTTRALGTRSSGGSPNTDRQASPATFQDRPSATTLRTPLMPKAADVFVVASMSLDDKFC